MGIAERFAKTSDHLAQVCVQAGRDPSDVRLIAVSKTVGLEEVAEAIAAGACDFGENRPDELMRKADVYPQVNWHFIGNIQSRRIRDIVGRATLVHSLFEERHARKIDEVAAEHGIVQDVLLEVNVSGEESKGGVAPDDLPALLSFCEGLDHVRVRGLMTMAPQGSEEVARQTFDGLAELHARVRAGMSAEQAECFTELSMGMSEDWPCAVPAGATMVRVGRAIFSDLFE